MYMIFAMAIHLFAQRADADSPLLTFGVIADVQYCDCDDRDARFYRASLQKLADAVQDLNERNAAFVVQLGDLIDGDFRNFDPILAIAAQFQSPVYHVPGNHDFLVEAQEKPFVLKKLELANGYYAFRYASWRFIALNGNDLSQVALAESDEKYREAQALYQQKKNLGLINAEGWNGALSEQQMDWLNRMLKEASQNGEKVIIFCHFPVFPQPNIHNLWNDQEVVQLLEQYKNTVAAYISGHNHAGNYALNNGIHYLNLRGMVETADQNAYAIIEVYADHLNVIGRGREPQRILSIQ